MRIRRRPPGPAARANVTAIGSQIVANAQSRTPRAMSARSTTVLSPGKPPPGLSATSAATTGRPGARRACSTASVTVSIGLADSTAGDGSPEAVLKKADQALYRAKEEGRNRVST